MRACEAVYASENKRMNGKQVSCKLDVRQQINAGCLAIVQLEKKQKKRRSLDM